MLALATDAIGRSVAGSITSKRSPSDDLRHLPPIHRSVGTLARRLSYMDHSLGSCLPRPLIPAHVGTSLCYPSLRFRVAFAGTSGVLSQLSSERLTVAAIR